MAQDKIRTTVELLNETFTVENQSINTTISSITADDVQNPLPTNGDSVYVKDLWLEQCITTDWIDADDTGEDLIKIPFNNLHTSIRNSTINNPKSLLIHFNRTVNLFQVGIGCDNHTGETFSNAKIDVLGSGGVSRTLLDDSTNDEKYTSRNYNFAPQLGNAIRLQFYSEDSICISNITIQKVSNVASQLLGIQPDESLINIGATNSGNLKTTDAENGLAIAKGDVQDTSFIHKFGQAPDFDTSDDFVDIWDGADDSGINQMNYVFSSSAIIDSLSSSDNADLQNIEIQGLDSGYTLCTQTIKLDGQTRVALDINLIRVFRLKNVGNVDISGFVYCYEDTPLNLGVPIDTTKIRAIINNGNNQTLMAIFTIPAGKTGYMRDWYAAQANAKNPVTESTSTIKLFARPFGQVFQLKHISSLKSNGTANTQHTYTEPEIFYEKTDIIMKANSSADESAVAGGFDIVLVDN